MHRCTVRVQSTAVIAHTRAALDLADCSLLTKEGIYPLTSPIGVLVGITHAAAVLRSLSHLSLARCRFTDTAAPLLCRMHALQSLVLDRLDITSVPHCTAPCDIACRDAAVEQLARASFAPNLAQLQLNECVKVTQHSLQFVALFPSLSVLGLAGTQVRVQHPVASHQYCSCATRRLWPVYTCWRC